MSYTLTDLAVRRQVLLERFKASAVRGYIPFLQQADAHIRDRLSRGKLTDFSRTRLETQLRGIREALHGVYSEFNDQMSAELRELALDSAAFEAKSIATFAPRADIATPGPSQLWSAVSTAPLTMTGANGGQILESFMASWAAADADMVTNAIRMGYALGETNEQILARVRGSAAMNFADGVLATNRAHASTVVRTAVQHAANQARAAIWEANSDIIDQYQWVSTLDSRTTPICRDRDLDKFEVGKGPLPPAHPNCRSTTVAVLKGALGEELEKEGTRASVDGQVKASESYYDWLQKQPAEFQDLALGPTRGKLFRDGGLSTDEFSRLQLSKNFDPATLAEMRELEPAAFARAGLGGQPPVAAPPQPTMLEKAMKTVEEAARITITGKPYEEGSYIKALIPYDEEMHRLLNAFGGEDRGRVIEAIRAHRDGVALLPIEDLPVASLKTIQDFVSRDGLFYRLNNPGFVAQDKYDTPQIMVIRFKGQYYVWDGNHRATSALLLDEGTIQALVIDLGP